MRTRSSSALYAFLFVLLPATAVAGQAVAPPTRDTSAIPVVVNASADTLIGPTAVNDSAFAAPLAANAVAQPQHRSLFARVAARAGSDLGQSKAMMVVGLGGLIVGAIIGGTPGTIIMVGGAVVGLVGLYNYLQ